MVNPSNLYFSQLEVGAYTDRLRRPSGRLLMTRPVSTEPRKPEGTSKRRASRTPMCTSHSTSKLWTRGKIRDAPRHGMNIGLFDANDTRNLIEKFSYKVSLFLWYWQLINTKSHLILVLQNYMRYVNVNFISCCVHFVFNYFIITIVYCSCSDLI